MKKWLPLLIAVPTALVLASLLDSGNSSPEELSAEIKAMCSERHPGNQDMIVLCHNRNVEALNGIGEWRDVYTDTSAGRRIRSDCSGYRPDWERVVDCVERATTVAKSKGEL